MVAAGVEVAVVVVVGSKAVKVVVGSKEVKVVADLGVRMEVGLGVMQVEVEVMAGLWVRV